MNKVTSHRLLALDGIRGFAIILVFLNHINTGYLQGILPQNIFGWIFSNGVTGVTFLFILSGFLMSSIYPNPTSSSEFLQKRYTRIFPLFLTMCVIMFVGRLTANPSPLFFLEILVGFPLCTYILWVYGIKKLPKIFGKILFFTFLTLQVLVGLFYVLWIAKQPFVVFNTQLPTYIREGTIFLVNATLTLPLGQYVPMLDGVYWTLVAEVLFYVLYPIFILPLTKMLSKTNMKTKILFLVCLIPLLGGIHMLSYKIFILSLIQPALFFYFATGIFLGYLHRKYTEKFEIFSKKIFSGVFALIPFLLLWVTAATVHDLSFLGQVISPWVRMLYAIPLTFLVAILLDRKTLFAKFFSTKVLVFVGTVSYSIYLSHSLVIHVATLLALPTNLFTDVAYILIVFFVNCLVASYLFFFLERPYFTKSSISTSKQVKAKLLTSSIKPGRLSTTQAIVSICIVYLVGIFFAYQSQNGLNFFSYTSSITQNSSQAKIDASHPLTLTITPVSDNFGLILLRIHHTPKKQSEPQALLFSLTEKGSDKPYTQASYSLDNFNSNEIFPFGFPTISHTKGKTYVAQFKLTNPKSQDFVRINTTTAKAVYGADKKQLLTHPALLIQFISLKVLAVIANPEAQITLFLILPFSLFSFTLWRILL